MAISNPVFSFSFLPVNTANNSQSESLKSSSSFSVPRSMLYSKAAGRMHGDVSRRRSSAVVSAMQPGVPPPSEPSFQLLNWLAGFVVTMVIPFLTSKWGSLLKIKNEVETAVDTIEEIVEVVEKVAEEVDKVAEDISDHLPEGGNLRKAVDFIENVAERVDKDAHLVDDLIDKVQEAEDKLEERVESLAEEIHEIRSSHEHHDNETPNATVINEKL